MLDDGMEKLAWEYWQKCRVRSDPEYVWLADFVRMCLEEQQKATELSWSDTPASGDYQYISFPTEARLVECLRARMGEL